MERAIHISDQEVYHVTWTGDMDPTVAISLAGKAAALGNNVGLDEFDEARLTRLLEVSDVAMVTRDGGEKVGLTLLQPSPYGRRVIPLTAYVHVILAVKEGATELYSALVNTCVQRTIEKSLGYLGLLTSVFTPCVTWYEKLREKGFTLSATWPSAGKVRKLGSVDNYLMHRRFTGEEIKGKIAGKDEQIKRADELSREYSRRPLAPVGEVLAMRKVTAEITVNGKKYRRRPVRPEDGPFIYECIQFAASLNLGYLEDQFPTYDYFYHTRLMTMTWGITETMVGEMIMAEGTAATTFTRSLKPQFCYGAMVLNPQFIGTKTLSNFMDAIACTMSMWGHAGWLDHIISSNIPVIESMRSQGAVFVGCVPDSGLQDGKPVDSQISYLRFTDTNKQQYEKLNVTPVGKL